jgi:hypothetical protein
MMPVLEAPKPEEENKFRKFFSVMLFAVYSSPIWMAASISSLHI